MGNSADIRETMSTYYILSQCYILLLMLAFSLLYPLYDTFLSNVLNDLSTILMLVLCLKYLVVSTALHPDDLEVYSLLLGYSQKVIYV